MHCLQKAKAAPDPLVKKRKEFSGNGQESKKVKADLTSQVEKLKSSTIPLWNVPYSEQVSVATKRQTTIAWFLFLVSFETREREKAVTPSRQRDRTPESKFAGLD